jgi:hypothetical protein
MIIIQAVVDVARDGLSIREVVNKVEISGHFIDCRRVLVQPLRHLVKWLGFTAAAKANELVVLLCERIAATATILIIAIIQLDHIRSPRTAGHRPPH